MWEIVKFLDENAVEAVPSVWILHNDKCFWPPYSTDKLKKSILLCETPRTNWGLNKIQILSTGQIDDYKVARQKSVLAQTDSDIEGSVLPGKRIPIKNRRFLSEDESEDAENLEFNDFPVYTDVSHKEGKEKSERGAQLYKKRREHPSCSSDSQLFHKQRQETQCLEVNRFDVQVASRSISNKHENRSFKHNDSAELHNVQQLSSSRSDSRSSSCNSLEELERTLTQEKAANYKFLELRTNKIIRILSGLSVKLDEMSEDIQLIKEHLTAGHTKTRQEKVVPGIYSEFPIKLEETLVEFESFLEVKENFSRFVDYLYVIGGNTTYDCVKRALNRVLSNSIGMNYNWEGIRGKKKFQTLNLCRALSESVRRLKVGCTEKDVEKDVKSWLKHAKERQAKEKKET